MQVCVEARGGGLQVSHAHLVHVHEAVGRPRVVGAAISGLRQNVHDVPKAAAIVHGVAAPPALPLLLDGCPLRARMAVHLVQVDAGHVGGAAPQHAKAVVAQEEGHLALGVGRHGGQDGRHAVGEGRHVDPGREREFGQRWRGREEAGVASIADHEAVGGRIGRLQAARHRRQHQPHQARPAGGEHVTGGSGMQTGRRSSEEPGRHNGLQAFIELNLWI